MVWVQQDPQVILEEPVFSLPVKGELVQSYWPLFALSGISVLTLKLTAFWFPVSLRHQEHAGFHQDSETGETDTNPLGSLPLKKWNMAHSSSLALPPSASGRCRSGIAPTHSELSRGLNSCDLIQTIDVFFINTFLFLTPLSLGVWILPRPTLIPQPAISRKGQDVDLLFLSSIRPPAIPWTVSLMPSCPK